MSAAQLAALRKYVGAVRNVNKRDYARLYLAWIVDGRPDGRDPEPVGLSYMGAQAVRLAMAAIIRDVP